ncbi:hypothetical protein DFJ77DRAFT_437641 [Powellomyces hirtus]|nr:hypothetical protein DFJ77DRAFT_437641 [Powellomyces hirtus]
MPLPPPPPPPPPPPLPSNLLSTIQEGTKLKKVQTNNRSGLLLPPPGLPLPPPPPPPPPPAASPPAAKPPDPHASALGSMDKFFKSAAMPTPAMPVHAGHVYIPSAHLLAKPAAVHVTQHDRDMALMRAPFPMDRPMHSREARLFAEHAANVVAAMTHEFSRGDGMLPRLGTCANVVVIDHVKPSHAWSFYREYFHMKMPRHSKTMPSHVWGRVHVTEHGMDYQFAMLFPSRTMALRFMLDHGTANIKIANVPGKKAGRSYAWASHIHGFLHRFGTAQLAHVERCMQRIAGVQGITAVDMEVFMAAKLSGHWGKH